MTLEEYEAAVRAIGCVLCMHMGREAGPASLHHPEGRGDLSRWLLVPLCWECHQGPNGLHGLQRRGFRIRYNLDEMDLLALVNRELTKRRVNR